MMNPSFFRTVSRSAGRLSKIPAASRSAAERGYATAFKWEDPLLASELYTEDELAIQETARQYCQERLQPRVLGKCSAASHAAFL
jgi:glutaryl-CoA dehydrogenase